MALNSYKEERKNMSYTALYRKFRPDAFSDVKGQDHIVTTLKNQLRANRIGHAYLFTGTRGTGKTTVAKIFAKTVNCEHPTEDGPCGECRICKAIAAGASMNVIEIDAASNNGVDNIREIIDEVSYSPAEGKYKVYIIDEVHMLSPGAFNALLKTLEEPPSYVIFILATTEVHKIPITILSRCQRYDFKRISIDTITDRMKELMDTEQVQVEDRALRYIAKVADGSMRDALSLLDQCAAVGGTVDSRAVLEAIRPEKDVDAFHPENVGRLMLGLPRFLPCTPAGVMALLRAYGISPAGKHCVVIGRSNIVGKPMALLLLAEDATVTVCHSRTPDLAEQCRRADILISAVGRRGLITSDMVKPGAVVVDVAMNRNEEGKLCGDVDFAAVAEKAAYITPVPGGVGPMTRAMLMENTISASRRRQHKEG